MKILGLLGSPRAGNSETLFNAFAKEAKKAGAQVQSIWLKSKNFAPCAACDGCSKTGECIVKDDFQQIASAIDKSDVLVLATPVHFGGPSAHMTTFFSRCQSLWVRKYVLEKKGRRKKAKRAGILIVTSYEKNPDYIKCVKQMSKYIFNSLDFTPLATFWFANLDKPRDASSQPKLLEKMRGFGKLVAQKRWKKLKW